jgi:hypothetical protein
MAEGGLLSPGEVADLVQACLEEYLTTLDDDEYDVTSVGAFNRMRELAGFRTTRTLIRLTRTVRL